MTFQAKPFQKGCALILRQTATLISSTFMECPVRPHWLSLESTTASAIFTYTLLAFAPDRFPTTPVILVWKATASDPNKWIFVVQ